MYSHKVRGRGRIYPRGGGSTMQASEGPSRSVNPLEYNRTPTKNISKHDNNCCREIGLLLEFDEYESNFYAELKRMWTMLKKSPPVENLIKQYFNSCDNPYIRVLRLLFNCQDFFNAKTKTLPLFIIEEFQAWSKICRNKIVQVLSADIKIDAFKVLCKQNSLTLSKLIVECFELVESNGLFLDFINCFIQKKQYKEACLYCSLLKLHSHYNIEQFLIPLVIQDKLQVIDEFLTNSPKHQMELVQWLDSILENQSISNTISEYVLTHQIPEAKFDKLHAKPWKKTIARMLKMFKLSQQLTPNLNKRRNEGALQFILHKKFIDNSFSNDSYREMVQEAVGNDKELQRELVTQVCMYGEFSEGLHWAQFYSLDRKFWPHAVLALDENPQENSLQQNTIIQSEESWDDELQDVTEYHKFSLRFDSITLINSPKTFEKFLKTGLKDVDIVGIDCEWKPTFGTASSELALMQIATRNAVFIFDVINLGNKVPLMWQELGVLLFNNCDILKLGFSISGDISMIRQALPELNLTHKIVGFLDLCSLWKLLEKHQRFSFPYEVKSGGPSLSTLVQHCLGKPLDKSDQFSNWEKRPLRDNQLTYAALDAFCLIEVFDVLRRCCDNGNAPFDETVYNLQTNEKAPKRKPKKNVKRTDFVLQAPSPHIKSYTADKIKIVCDTCLQGLGKNLRRIGVDTVCLENHQDHMECVRYAQNEDRYILTRGVTFNKLQGCVPKGNCLKIISEDVDEQLKEVIEYYKIIVSKDNVFSRCQACNSNRFLKVPRSTITALVNASKMQHCLPPPSRYYNDEASGYYEDEATGFTSDEDYDEEPPGPPVGYMPNSQVNRTWQVDETASKVDIELCQTKSGATIQITQVPSGIIDKHEFFYICEDCGKIFWDGSHFEKVLNGRLRGIVQ